MSYDSQCNSNRPDGGGEQFHGWNSNWNYLEQRHFTILAVCKQPLAFQQVLELTGIPRATAFRHLKRLCADGLVRKAGEAFLTTDIGRHALTRPPLPTYCADILQIWPFLRRMPSRLHAAMAELTLLGVIARKFNLSTDQNPSFCLLGKSGQLKTWLLKYLCKILGISADDALKMMPQARARSLIGRLDGQGQLAWKNPALAEPLLGLIEHAKARPEVKEDVTTLLQGTSSISLDGHSIDIQATVAVEMNYLKEDATTLVEQTGFDLSQRRRLFTADFTGVDLSPAIKAAALKCLESLPSDPSLHLPDAPAADLPEDAKRYIRRIVNDCVKPEYMDEIDLGRVETLVRAARAIYPEPVAAARFVLEHVLEIYASTNFTKIDWRSVLNSTTGYSTEAAPNVGAPEPQQNWKSVREELKARGEDPAAISDKIAALLQVMRQLREQKVSDAEIFSILENIPKLLKLNLLLHRLNLDPEHAIVLCQIEQALGVCRCTPEQAHDAIETFLGLNQLGLTSEAAWTFAHSIVEAIEEGGEARAAASILLEAARDQISLQEEIRQDQSALQRLKQICNEYDQKIQALSEEHAQLNSENALLFKEFNNLNDSVQRIERQNFELDQVRSEKQAAIEALQRKENETRGKTMAIMVLYRLLFDPDYMIHPEVRKAVENLLWAIKSDGKIGNLDDAYAEIVRIGDATRANFGEPPNEAELLEKDMAKKRAECIRVREAYKVLENQFTDLVKTSFLLKAYEICISPKVGQEVLRQNLMAEIDRLQDLMMGRIKCQDPQSEINAVVERIRLFLEGGLNAGSEQVSPS